jgi:PKD repeat protein
MNNKPTLVSNVAVIKSVFSFLIILFASIHSFSQTTCSAQFQFYANPHNGDSIHFAPQLPGSNLATYHWTFGDGSTSTLMDPWHLYTNGGAYWVCLTVITNNGSTCNWCDSVHVVNSPPPTCNAHFQFYTNPHNSDSLHFYASSPQSNATYSWNFGDGTTGTGADPWHLYSNSGAYWVCLTVSVTNGQTCNWCDSIHVLNPPPPTCNAHFQYSANYHNPDSIHFSPAAPGSTASYLWTFGDGNTSTNVDPWHLYSAPGAYYVCLTVTLSNGTTCNWCDSIHVVNLPPPTCNAHFQFYANNHNPDSIHFSPAALISTASYSWSFGDGNTSTNADPWHLYSAPGAYYVCLTVTLSNGTTCYWCDSIHVVNLPPPTCNAHFQFYSSPHNPDSIHFYSVNPQVSTSTYSWTFGDGTSGTGAYPWHLYSAPGAYYVCLTINTSNGGTCTWCDSIHVINLPPPACNAHFQYYFNPHNVDSIHFTAVTSTTAGAIYSWTFGDGSTGTGADPWHFYPNAGTYYVCLDVTLNGNTCHWCDSIHIITPPPPVCNAHYQFYANPHNPDSIHFYPQMPVASGATYSWTFGDGNSSTNHDPWHFFATTGTYYVCLTVTLTNGTSCNWCDSIHVMHLPQYCNAHYQHYPNPHNPDSVHFYPSVINSHSAIYQWSFGDGTTSTNHDPWHLYPGPGVYYVCLTLTLVNGTSCTSCDSIHVVNPPPPPCNAYFQFYPNPNNHDSLHYYPVTSTAAATYLWNFGDGTTSTAHDPWHLYSTPGMYFTCLTITLSNGTVCTYCDSVMGIIANPQTPVKEYLPVVKVNPNPVNNFMQLQLDHGDGEYNVNICDFTGQPVLKSKVSANSLTEINTSSIQPGVYYYIVSKGDELISQGRIVVYH